MHKRDHVTRYRPMFSVGSWSFERENQSLPSLCFSVSISRKNQKKSTVMIVGLCPCHITILFCASKLLLQGCYDYFIRNIHLVSGDFFHFFMGREFKILQKNVFPCSPKMSMFFFLGGEC